MSVEDLSKKTKKTVGSILFEGSGAGMHRLGTFDEMMGCNKCNAIHHKNTRFNLKLDGNRASIMMQGKTRADESTCKDYKITGSKSKHSISFECGPFTKDPFKNQVKDIKIW